MKRLITTLLTFAMLLSLCIGFTGCKKVSSKDYTENPSGVLLDSLNASNNAFFTDDVGVGKVVAKAIQGGSLGFSFESALLGDVNKIAGTLYMDGEGKNAILDATLGYKGEDLNAKLYVDEKYIAVGGADLLGSDRVLGIYPGSLADGFGESALAGMLGLGAEAMAQIEQMLGELKEAWATLYAEQKDAEEKFHAAVNEMLALLSPTVATEKANITGTNTKYIIATYRFNNATIRAFGQKLLAEYKDELAPILDAVAVETGKPVDLEAEFKKAMDEMDAEATISLVMDCYIDQKTERMVQMTLTGTVDPKEADEKTTQVDCKATFGDEAIILSVAADDGEDQVNFVLSLNKKLEGDAITYTLTLDDKADDYEEALFTLAYTYNKTSGAFDASVSYYQERDLGSLLPLPGGLGRELQTFSVSGTVKVESKRAAFAIDKISIPGGITLDIKLALTFNAEAEMPAKPENVKDVLTLTEEELATVMNEVMNSKIVGIFSGMNGITPYAW